ncbi:hypothetical protein [Antarcticirhabdus aurantiaca]|uniref:Uncharacterized protein n=1 Tax=Antarcticirhabdus aurantiaca TaxID=2606717 RepID=A0ACD4NHC5_9HYPH|nr:hypothetical protein [Antarcticirhabdus aurantiaca]WAJ26197.1 hypothetical protein OXU80_14885 [Jeongeuplla avenae]
MDRRRDDEGGRSPQPGTVRIDRSSVLFQDWLYPQPPQQRAIERAMVDVYLVGLIAAVVIVAAVGVWFGLQALGIGVLDAMMLEFALAVLGSIVAIASFLLAR